MPDKNRPAFFQPHAATWWGESKRLTRHWSFLIQVLFWVKVLSVRTLSAGANTLFIFGKWTHFIIVKVRIKDRWTETRRDRGILSLSMEAIKPSALCSYFNIPIRLNSFLGFVIIYCVTSVRMLSSLPAYFSFFAPISLTGRAELIVRTDNLS